MKSGCLLDEDTRLVSPLPFNVVKRQGRQQKPLSAADIDQHALEAQVGLERFASQVLANA